MLPCQLLCCSSRWITLVFNNADCLALGILKWGEWILSSIEKKNHKKSQQQRRTYYTCHLNRAYCKAYFPDMEVWERANKQFKFNQHIHKFILSSNLHSILMLGCLNMRVANLTVNTNTEACHPLIVASWSMVSAGCVECREKRSTAHQLTICLGLTTGTLTGCE